MAVFCATVIQNLVILTGAMFNKRGRPHQDEEEPPLRRLRSNIADLFLSNQVSAQRAQTLFNDAAHTSQACAEMVSKGRGTHTKGRGRDILRRLLKGCLWPPLYKATIPVFNKKTLQKQNVQLAFLLPHEVCHKFFMLHEKHVLLQTSGMSEDARCHLHKMNELYNCTGLGISLWMDGTPFNYDRTQSLESITIGFPGLPKPNDTLRVPCTMIKKDFCIKHETIDAIMTVLQWSFQSLASGMFPKKPMRERSSLPKIGLEDTMQARRWDVMVSCVKSKQTGHYYQMYSGFHPGTWVQDVAGDAQLHLPL